MRPRPSPSLCWVGSHITRFEACSTFTRVTACRHMNRPRRPFSIEGSSRRVAATAAPIASGWSNTLAGRDSHPLKTTTFSRRTKGSGVFSPW
ncbi:MAG: DUF4081 domain-containing protein [Nitrospira sp.]